MALAVWQWLKFRPTCRPIVRTAAISLAICAAYSLFDQCHKLFVPGRHWDTFDLAMDALGYVSAIIIVVAITAIAARHTRRNV